MSKSTPISQLQDNSKPLVDDILKEIENDNDNDNQNIEIQMDSSQIDNSQLVDNSSDVNYSQQQAQALQYQIDPNINNANVLENDLDKTQTATPAIENNENIHYNFSNDNQQLNILNDKPVVESSLWQSIVNQTKNPLLVGLIVILLSNPFINGFILKQINRLGSSHNEMLVNIVKALLAGVLFYLVNKFI